MLQQLRQSVRKFAGQLTDQQLQEVLYQGVDGLNHDYAWALENPGSITGVVMSSTEVACDASSDNVAGDNVAGDDVAGDDVAGDVLPGLDESVDVKDQG